MYHIILDHIDMGFKNIKMEFIQLYQINGYCKLKWLAGGGFAIMSHLCC